MSSLFISYIFTFSIKKKKKLATPKLKQPKFFFGLPCMGRRHYGLTVDNPGLSLLCFMVLSPVLCTLICQDQAVIAARSVGMLLFLGRSQNMQHWILK